MGWGSDLSENANARWMRETMRTTPARKPKHKAHSAFHTAHTLHTLYRQGTTDVEYTSRSAYSTLLMSSTLSKQRTAVNRQLTTNSALTQCIQRSTHG